MTNAVRKTKTKPVAGDRVPVTAKACWGSIALFGSLALFTIGVTLTGGISVEKLARVVQMLFIAWPAYYSLWLLSRMRRGERFETVYSEPSPKLRQTRLRGYKSIAVGMNLLLACFSVFMIHWMRGSHPDATILLLVSNVIFLVAGLFLFLRAGKLSHTLESKIALVTEDVPTTGVHNTARAEIPHQANAAEAGANRTAGHWWTDTQAREENKITAGRR